MSKAEKFISDFTRNCSNEYLTDGKLDGFGGYISRRKFTPWLTPDQARRAVEIAREEMIERACSFIENNIGDYIELKNAIPTTFFEIDADGFTNNLKQAMTDEQGRR